MKPSVIGAFAIAAALTGGALTALADAGPVHQKTIAHYAALAKAKDPSFAGFSPEAGRAFFFAEQTGGAGEASNCTVCHGADPKKPGETRAGKPIDPIAVSVNPQRFTDLEFIEKWFGRNCDTVLGRECTTLEKGNFLTFMTAQ
jgi:Domain of unknown function (DUF1924)